MTSSDKTAPSITCPIGYSPLRKNTVTVSIGLPVYNGENFIEEAIESLLDQTFRDFELIVSDNASTDATPDIVRKFQEKDHRIRYIRQDYNIGPAKNYIFVLTQAKGKFFMWASHDDIWATNWLETLIDNIMPEDIGVRGELFLIQETAIVARRMLPNFRHGDFIRCFLGNESNYRTHYVYSLFDRKRLLATEPETFNLDYFPDALFVYCLLEQGNLRSITGTHIRSRIHDQNLGMEYSRKWKGWKKILYRIHPLRYYCYYLTYTKCPTTRFIIATLIPIKHIYAQASFWVRGFREIVTGKPFR